VEHSGKSIICPDLLTNKIAMLHCFIRNMLAQTKIIFPMPDNPVSHSEDWKKDFERRKMHQ